jgi:hypothetical protein
MLYTKWQEEMQNVQVKDQNCSSGEFEGCLLNWELDTWTEVTLD